MIERLMAIENRYNELAAMLSDPEILSDIKKNYNFIKRTGFT